jgi:hypothetical protein
MKVGRKGRSCSDDWGNSSSSKNILKQSRIGACVDMGEILADMDVFHGLKKKKMF